MNSRVSGSHVSPFPRSLLQTLRGGSVSPTTESNPWIFLIPITIWRRRGRGHHVSVTLSLQNQEQSWQVGGLRNIQGHSSLGQEVEPGTEESQARPMPADLGQDPHPVLGQASSKPGLTDTDGGTEPFPEKRGTTSICGPPVLSLILVVPLSKFYRCHCGQLCLKLPSLSREEESKTQSQRHLMHVTQEGKAETWAHSQSLHTNPRYGIAWF